ncbi:MAG: sulfotransferase family protein [Acidimicrobiales bacterium]
MSRDHLEPYLQMEGICPNPVFVIGSPRSGTTALAQSLNRHPDLRVGKESYVLHDFFGRGKPSRVWNNQMNRVTPCWVEFEKVEHDEFLGFLGLGMNALFSSRAEGKRWIDQTPLYTPMVSTLAAMFPGASFVHIVRDGRHVVRSMVNFERKFDDEQLANAQPNEIPQWSNDFEEGCGTWSHWVASALDFGADHPQRCISVHNEELSADPETGFARIQDFLGLEPHPGSARFFGKKRINSSWKQDPSRPDDDDWLGWDSERRRTFVDIAGATMARAGYGSTDELENWAHAG